MSRGRFLDIQIFLSLTTLFLFGNFAVAAVKPSVNLSESAVPGEVRTGGDGARIFLEMGRSLLWPNQGLLVLEDAGGGALAKIDLQAKAVRENGAEAMGLNIEETDLGGSLGSKKYLKGKKSPVGKTLDSTLLAGTPAAGEAGQISHSVVQGIPISITTYPNGSSLWKLEWPNFTEEIYFDRKKSLISDQQTRHVGSFNVILKQFADGSYIRQYRSGSGSFEYVYDANDQGARLVFSNSKGETVAEWTCQDTCSSGT